MALPRIDNFPVQYMDLNDDVEKWLTNLVDTLNAILDQLDADLATIDARLTACGC
jgi:hypothetical protein